MSGKVQKRGKVSQQIRVRKSTKAGLTFPVSRFQRALKKGNYAKLIGVGGSVYVTAVLEYLTAEILELSGIAARDHNRKRIKPRHITLAVRNDFELDTLLKDVTISEGGVLPFVHSVLLKKNSKPKKSRKVGKKNKEIEGAPMDTNNEEERVVDDEQEDDDEQDEEGAPADGKKNETQSMEY